MNIIHMEKEATITMAQKYRNFCEALNTDNQMLLQNIRSLSSLWQGNSHDEFQSEIEMVVQSISRLQIEFENLSVILNQEIDEWEEMDVWTSRVSLLGVPFPSSGYLPISGGEYSISGFWPFSILPMSALVSVEELMNRKDLPSWLSNLLDRIFGKSENPPFSPTELKPEDEQKSALGELLDDSPEINTNDGLMEESGSTPETKYYKVPARSQGALYGSAACSPTSVSMVLDYYHAQNPENVSVEPAVLIQMMDSGDGTPGQGIALDKLTDELNSLGYNNIGYGVGATIDSLEAELQNGPVIVTTGIQLVGSTDAPRAINGPGSTFHAMVVTGISDNGVYVNDPWSGSKLEFSLEQFSTMWANGQNGYYSIRP